MVKVGTLSRELLDLNQWKHHTPEDNSFKNGGLRLESFKIGNPCCQASYFYYLKYPDIRIRYKDLRSTHPKTHLYSLLKVCVLTTSRRWGSVHLRGGEGINKHAPWRLGIGKHALYRENFKHKKCEICVTFMLSSIAALN